MLNHFTSMTTGFKQTSVIDLLRHISLSFFQFMTKQIQPALTDH